MNLKCQFVMTSAFIVNYLFKIASTLNDRRQSNLLRFVGFYLKAN